MQRLQNRGLRICFNADPRTPIIRLHRLANLNFLSDRREFALSVLAYQHRNDEKWKDNSVSVTRIHDGPLLKQFRSNSRIFENSILMKSAKIWNALDIRLRNSPTIEEFKTSMKRRLSINLNQD